MFYGLEAENIVFDLSVLHISAILLAGLIFYIIIRSKGVKVRPLLFFIIFLFPTSGLYIDLGFHLFYHRVLLIIYSMFFILRKFLLSKRSGSKNIIVFNATILSAIFFLFSTLPGLVVCLDLINFSRWWIAILASILLMIFILDELNDKNQLESLIFTCIVTGFFWSVVGLYLFFVVNIDFNAADFRNVYRLAGLMKDPNLFASILICWIEFSIFWVLKKDAPYKFFSILAMLTMCTALIFTYSRSGYLCFSIVVSINLFLLGVVYRRKFISFIDHKKAMLLTVVIFLIFIVSIVFSSSLVNRIMSIKTDTSGAGRVHVWKDAFNVAIKNPIGVGLNNFKTYTKKYSYIYRTSGSSVHNTYFQLLAETGWVGLLAYLFFTTTILIKFVYIRIIKDVHLSYWLTGSIVSFISIIISSMFITCIYYEHVFITAAFVIGIYQISKREKKEQLV